MKTALLALLIALATPCLAANSECPIDQHEHLKHLRLIARHHTGSTINPSKLTAAWSSQEFSKVRVEIGGCEHFGLHAVGTVKSKHNVSEQEVFALANKLARAVLAQQEAASIAKSLDNGEYTKTSNEGAEHFSLELQGFQEFGFSVNHRAGFVEISLSGTGE